MCCAAATTRRPCFFFAGVKTPLHEILIKFLSCVRTLRARQEIRCAFWRERRAGRCEAPRRRRCRCASSRSGNKADARPPPRPSGLRPAGPLAVLLAPYIPHRLCSSLAPCQRAWGPAAKCTPYFLTGPNLGNARKRGLLRAVAAWSAGVSGLDETQSESARKGETGKFSTARCVCAPQSAAFGTRPSPIESYSIL